MNRKLVLFIMGATFLNLTTVTAHGTNSKQAASHPSPTKIVAVVNEHIITAPDFRNRLKLAILSSGLPDSAEVRDHLSLQILKTMIDEKLQQAEIDKYEIKVDDSQVGQAIANIEQQNKMPSGYLKNFLSANSIPLSALQNQIRTNLGWVTYIREKYSDTIHISDREIDRVMQNFEINKNLPHYLVGEIFLRVDASDQDSKVRRDAMELIHNLQKGAPFPAVAQQFSQSASAARGGDIGWIIKGQLDEKLEEALKALQAGQIAGPIRTTNGYYILLLRESPKVMDTLPSREGIHADLMEQRMSLLAQRELRDIRRAAYIDVRQ